MGQYKKSLRTYNARFKKDLQLAIKVFFLIDLSFIFVIQ